MISTLHLLIVQATIWVLVQSDTFASPLWVGVTKAALFRGLLHINAVGGLVECIKCGGSHHPFNHVKANPFSETFYLQFDLLW